MERIRHKRGDTIDWPATYTIDGLPEDLTAYVIAAQARQKTGGDWVGNFTVAKEADQVANKGKYRLVLPAAGMASWPLGELVCDIQYTLSGVVASSETFMIVLEMDVTRP